MRKTIYNIFMLIAVPLTLLPILLGAADELEARRKESYFRMRREHLWSQARDRKRRAERLQHQQSWEASHVRGKDSQLNQVRISVATDTNRP